MTEQEIDAMEAGREMDEATHRAFWPEDEILQLPWWDGILRQYRKPKREEAPHSAWVCLPLYSTDIGAAWLVVEKLRELGFWCRMDTPWINDGSPADRFWAGFTPHQTTGWNGRPDYWEEGDTLPLAICRAALKVAEKGREK